MNQKPDTPDWRHHGVRVIPGTQLDPNTPQTPGMPRAAAGPALKNSGLAR
jgi:uncharacterized RmlC-like cupin family protein